MLDNWGLVDFAKAALIERWGYVWGTFGQVLTPALFEYKLKQYPKEVGRYKDHIQKNYISKRTADCIGLIKAYLWWSGDHPVYTSETDKSANGMFTSATDTGPIGSLPELPGVCLWRTGHVGVYIGNNQVIEAKGTLYGVIQTVLNESGWTHWWKCPDIEYVPCRDFDKISDWAKGPVEKLKDQGIMYGSGERFRPKDSITREEVATVIYRTIQYLKS